MTVDFVNFRIMSMNVSLQTQQIILNMLKLGMGVISAVGIAWEIGLLNIYSAGSIALITLLTSKWDSLRTSLWRLVTYFFTVGVTFLLAKIIPWPIVCFGLAIMFIYLFCDLLRIRSVVAVNGVICSHFVASGSFTVEMIINEFLLVLIGVICALVFNHVYSEKAVRKEMNRRIQKDEEALANWLSVLADQLESGKRPLPSLKNYEKQLQADAKLAMEFDGNSWSKHSDYYKSYFGMRLKQVQVLQNLEWAMLHFSNQPRQTKTIAEYIRYLVSFIFETHFPIQQEKELKRLLANLKTEDLPKSREEFENRSVLYHVLLTLQEFITLKEQFIKGLSNDQKKAYWSDVQRGMRDERLKEKVDRNQ